MVSLVHLSIVRRVPMGSLGILLHRPSLHHSRRGSGSCMLTVHHVPHSRRVWWVPRWACRCTRHRAGTSPAVGLVNERLDNPSTRINEPIVDLQDSQASVLSKLLFLIFGRVGMGQVLKQSGP